VCAIVVHSSQKPRIGGQTPDIISAYSVQLAPLYVDMDLKRFTVFLGYSRNTIITVVRRLRELKHVKVHVYTGVIAGVRSCLMHCIQQWITYLRSPLPRAKKGIQELYMHTIRRPTCLHESLRVNVRLEPERSAMIEL
jgi:hypothetical protein